MEFSHITPKDTGRYYCMAENVHGNVTKQAEVVVKRNDIISNQPSVVGRTQHVTEGETASLDCSTTDEASQSGSQVNIIYTMQMWKKRRQEQQQQQQQSICMLNNNQIFCVV